jgi:hypothetical protein
MSFCIQVSAVTIVKKVKYLRAQELAQVRWGESKLMAAVVALASTVVCSRVFAP